MRVNKQTYELNNSSELLLLNQVEMFPKTIPLLLILSLCHLTRDQLIFFRFLVLLSA